MKRSKLEAYYEREFGPRDQEPDDSPDDSPDDQPVRRPRDSARRRRGGFGIGRMLKLTLMLGPMTLLLGAGFLMDCQGAAARGSWLPEIVHNTACARRNLAGRVLNLEGDLRTVANGLR
ncbi:hypothetical protein ASF49_08685 [Methylobacterium sp. Leaf104]|uniref:hypothetical protein n=1 Tax=Methylobacterium TaxID=407 RepID=UPI0007017E0F|nr:MULTISPECIES: hypothetical protein [Methylobacterium]KQP33919.1 hypothetical protein ASF49_08685 [Methylobacterium sp. Leaf104]MCI9879492.1 hypothetical protein [Methylobacterium goesingense]